SFHRFSCNVSKIQNTGHSQRISPWKVVLAWFCEKMQLLSTFGKVTCKVEFRLVFRAPFRKFKILAIPNVLAQGKSYEHG
ncbi:hypothetical protein BHM03_00060834, partial [Ensete ventricosum]